MKERRDNESNRGQRERDGGSARSGAIEILFFILNPAEEDGETENEQDVANDRSGYRGFHHISQAFGERDAGDDQLGGISESGVEQSAQTFPDTGGKRFGGAS